MMNRLFILGAGGHAKQVIDVFKSRRIKITGLFDDHKSNTFYHDYKIFDTIKNAKNYLHRKDLLFCAIGDNKIRSEVAREFNSYKFVNCISPFAVISEYSKIEGTGNYIGHFVNLMGDTQIGSQNIINDCNLIGHDVRIKDYNLLASQSCYGRGVEIGSYNMLGINISVIPGMKIGDRNVVGGGSVIIKDVGSNCTVVGNPGKVIKKNI